MQEEYPSRIQFQMLEGDFREFYGNWYLEEQPMNGAVQTRLSYELTVVPKRTMPVQLIECRLSRDLPQNLVAIYQRSVSA
jgi:ribosome-associated toxin RatA of RatAB toxin-antitoxin module